MEDQEEFTLEQFRYAVDLIVERAAPMEFHNVYGIPKGGLMLAITLANRLDIPLILTPDKITEHTLIAEDIVETGTTITRLNLTKNFVVSIHYKENPLYTPNFWVFRKKDAWIVYPWE